MAITPRFGKYLIHYFKIAPKMDINGMQEIVKRKYDIHVPIHVGGEEDWQRIILMTNITKSTSS